RTPGPGGSSAAPFVGRNASTLSPAWPITHTLVKTGTSAPGSKKVSSTVPATGAGSSNIVLSVSMSASTSPAATWSPLRLRQFAIRHSSTVLPRLGSSTGVAMLFKIFHRLPAHFTKLAERPLRRAEADEFSRLHSVRFVRAHE